MPEKESNYTMRTQAILLATAILTSAASAQTAERVLTFVHSATPQEFQEAATVVRSMAEIREVTVDSDQRKLTMRGTAAENALGEWLFLQLDQPANRPAIASSSATYDYRASGSPEDKVRVFYLAHAETPQQIQETSTILRSIADIRRVFTYNATRAIAVRGTADQLAIAEWLIAELDQAPVTEAKAASASSREYLMTVRPEDRVRILYPARAATPQELLQAAAAIRTQAGVRRVFTYHATQAVAVRGTEEQMAAAERLMKERN